jgi:hypothetical protein
MSAVRLLLGEKRTSRGQPISVAIDPLRTCGTNLESRLRAAFLFAICAGTFPDFVVKFLGAAELRYAI